MSNTTFQPRGLHFEQFEVGQKIITAGRTVTEADVIRFAGLTGDFNQIHTDAEYAASSIFEQRVAHALLVLSIAVGLAVQTGIIEGTTLAFRQVDTKFKSPVFFGDTVHVEIEITALKALARLGGGNVTMKYRVLNQRNETVMRGDWVMLIKGRPPQRDGSI